MQCEICLTDSTTTTYRNLMECDSCKKKCCIDYECKTDSCIAVIGWFGNVLCKLCISKFCDHCHFEVPSKVCTRCGTGSICKSCEICGKCKNGDLDTYYVGCQLAHMEL